MQRVSSARPGARIVPFLATVQRRPHFAAWARPRTASASQRALSFTEYSARSTVMTSGSTDVAGLCADLWPAVAGPARRLVRQSHQIVMYCDIARATHQQMDRCVVDAGDGDPLGRSGSLRLEASRPRPACRRQPQAPPRRHPSPRDLLEQSLAAGGARASGARAASGASRNGRSRRPPGRELRALLDGLDSGHDPPRPGVLAHSARHVAQQVHSR